MTNPRFKRLVESSVRHNRREILVIFSAAFLVCCLWLGLSFAHWAAALNGLVLGFLLAYRAGFRNGNLIGAIAATENPSVKQMVEAMADQENRN